MSNISGKEEGKSPQDDLEQRHSVLLKESNRKGACFILFVEKQRICL